MNLFKKPLSNTFPNYNPSLCSVPVYCVTPKTPGCIHRFFDTSPFSPSGRYMAFTQLPFEDRLPSPGEKCNIVVVDLETGDEKVVAESAGWEPQMGANIGWGESDDDLFFNDVDIQTWEVYAVKFNFKTGEKFKMDRSVYHVSADGRYLSCGTPQTMCRTQYGYGAIVPEPLVKIAKGLPEEDGLFITDTRSGKSKMIASVKDVLTKCNPPIDLSAYEGGSFYSFHSKFNAQVDRVLFTVRWVPEKFSDRFNTLHIHEDGECAIRFWVFTMKLDGSDICNAVPAEEWRKGGHHINWFPDGRNLSMNLNIYRDGMKLVRCGYDGKDLKPITLAVPGSGHPTVHPDGRHIVTDAYNHEPLSKGGLVPIRLIDLKTETEKTVVSLVTKTPWQERDSSLRVDPHPAWDRKFEWIAINGFDGETRRVYIADMRGMGV